MPYEQFKYFVYLPVRYLEGLICCSEQYINVCIRVIVLWLTRTIRGQDVGAKSMPYLSICQDL